MKITFLDYIKSRGYFNQCTNEEGLKKQLSKKLVAYTGFDCTAESLHVGSLVQIMMLRTFQKFGFKPIILLGGGTTLIGDPSGKDKTRKILNKEIIELNKQKITSIFERFLKFDNSYNSALILDNHDWLSNLNFIDFIRDIGSQFSVNRMLSFESVKQRLDREQNLSFLEFNYVLLQSYDFLKLYSDYGCNIQFGGSDQWGNIVSGIDLIKKKKKTDRVFGLTSPLITTANGEKMGKTVRGAVWLTKEKLSPYEYWQFWRNTSDSDVSKFLCLFTDISSEKIREISSLEGSELNNAKVLLANEATKICHGEEESKKAEQNSLKIFSNHSSDAELPKKNKFSLDEKEVIKLRDLLIKINLCNSSSESKKMIESGAVRIDGVKVEDKNFELKKLNYKTKMIKISVGKKKHGILNFL
ncbi:tyrosine--tRNA ligase [Alphaproteobacteria bacterium]|nr:tyrosine--tRNA ligase [Alphaproteobacteria bacterium]